MTFSLKPISTDGISGAIAKAERYRLLNEPGEAESICRDILEVEPENLDALHNLVLALTDQIPDDANAFASALETIERLPVGYDREYYTGIAWERRAKARFLGGGQGAKQYVYEWIATALQCFDKAQGVRPAANDDAVLRWNACVRFLDRNKLVPQVEEAPEPIASE